MAQFCSNPIPSSASHQRFKRGFRAHPARHGREVTQLHAIMRNQYAPQPRQAPRLGQRQPHRARPEAGEEKGQRQYRDDDYRIFVQSPQIGEAILKSLTEVLIDLGLKLNASKTTSCACFCWRTQLKALPWAVRSGPFRAKMMGFEPKWR